MIAANSIVIIHAVLIPLPLAAVVFRPDSALGITRNAQPNHRLSNQVVLAITKYKGDVLVGHCNYSS